MFVGREGVLCGAFYRVVVVRGQGGRAAAIGECGFNGFCYEVKKEGEEGELVGHCLMRGEYRRYGRCFGSSTMEHRRAPHGGAQRGGTGQAKGGSGDRGGRRPPGGLEWAAQAS
jgi:hypothetical protein